MPSVKYVASPPRGVAPLPSFEAIAPSGTVQHPLGTPSVIRVLLMPGEAEVDEPFLVEQPRRLLQQLNPPPVVLDQVVVGGEGFRLFLTCDGNGGESHFNSSDSLGCRVSYLRPTRGGRNLIPDVIGIE